MGWDPTKLPQRYQEQIRAGKKSAPVPRPRTPPPPPPTVPTKGKTASCELAVVMMGKPRMTQRDKWKKRPNVERYRALADEIRAAVPVELLQNVIGMDAEVYLPMSPSWSKAKRSFFAGKLHCDTPDIDNMQKALLDILFKQDRAVAFGRLIKYWDDGRGPRVLLTFHYEHAAYAGCDPANYRSRGPRKTGAGD